MAKRYEQLCHSTAGNRYQDHTATDVQKGLRELDERTGIAHQRAKEEFRKWIGLQDRERDHSLFRKEKILYLQLNMWHIIRGQARATLSITEVERMRSQKESF